MPPLAAAQHFFTSVPVEQSPNKRRGYQTLFCTRGLPDDVVRAIEDRAQYTTAPGDPVKRQFYPLPHDWFAIAQSVALADLDEFGRKGRYLTHTLVVPIQILEQWSGCPLDVLVQFSFARTLAEVFQQAQPNNRDVPAVKLNITPQWYAVATRVAQTWQPEALVRLARMAWQFDKLLQARESLAVIGNDKELLEILSLLFMLASPATRPRLSFDTHAAGCDWGRGVVFWAQGYASLSETRAPHVVDAPARTITSSLLPSDDGLFGLWMVKDGLPGGYASLWQKQNWAANLVLALTTSQMPDGSLPPIPPEFVQQFGRLNAAGVAHRWSAYFPPGLSPEFVQSLKERITRDPEVYFSIILEGVKPHDVGEFMLMALLENGSVPPRGDRAALEKWIDGLNHAGLQTLPALWAKDGKSWRKTLASLSPDDYEAILSTLVKWGQLPLPLWDAIVEPHMAMWVQWAGPYIPPNDWKKALSTLEKLGEPALDRVAEIAPRLPEPAQTEIGNWLKGYKGQAAALRLALSGAEKKSKGVFGLFG